MENLKNSKFKTLLKSIYIYGEEIKFKLRGSETTSSVLGGIISILFFISIIFIVVFNIKEFLFEKDPNIIYFTQQRNLSRKENIILSDLEMVMALGESNNNNIKPITSEVNISGGLVLINRSINSSMNPLSFFVNWDKKDNINKFFNKAFEKFSKSAFICMNETNNDFFKLGGHFIDSGEDSFITGELIINKIKLSYQ